MTANPFAPGGVNPYDLPGGVAAQRSSNGLIDIGGGVGIKADQIPTFDPAAKSVNPVGQALVDHIMAEVESRQATFADAVAELLAETVAPFEARCASLERQLQVERTKVAGAIRHAAAGFLGDDDPDQKRATANVRKGMRDHPEAYE